MKKDIIARREAKKNYNSYKAKKDPKPGPWTNLEAKFTTNILLRPVPSLTTSLPAFYGSYVDKEDWSEKGWYPIIFNICSKDMLKLIQEHGLDNFLIAAEKSLNKDRDYGHIIITSIHAPNATNRDATKRFISCEAKTNKKNIAGFMAIRNNKYVLL